jgi:hypothetical protein
MLPGLSSAVVSRGERVHATDDVKDSILKDKKLERG